MAYWGNEPAKVAVKVGANVITTAEIQDGQVYTADILDDAITAQKVDDDGTGFRMGSLGLGAAVSGSEKLTVGGTASFSGAITGNLTGNASGTAATVTTAAQPNITSLGTLSALAVTGTSTFTGSGDFVRANSNASNANCAFALSNQTTLKWSMYNNASDNSWNLYDHNGSANAITVATGGNATFAGATTINTSDSEQLMFKGATSPYLRFYESTTAKAYMQWHSDGYLNLENSEASTNLAVGANGIGIGTTSPTDKFQINYDADFYEVFDGAGTWTTKRGNGSTGGKRIVTDLSSGSWGTDGGYIEFKPRNSTAMTIQAGGNVGIGSSSVTDITTVWATGTVLDVHESSGSDTGAIILSGDTTTNGGGVGSLVWANRNNSGQASEEAGAEGKGIGIIVTNVVTSDSNSGDDSGGDMKFFTKPEAGTIAERMRITSAGKVGIGETGPSTSFHLKGAGVSNCGIALFQTTQTSADNHELLTFYDGGGALCGEVYVHATNHTTVFSTSSDYRLKENETAISDGLTRLNQLKPYKFNFKSNVDKTKVDGFFAHEVSSIVPEAVVGEKDAVDDDGEIKKQMIDHSKLVPLLVAAVQELSAKVEALENA